MLVNLHGPWTDLVCRQVLQRGDSAVSRLYIHHHCDGSIIAQICSERNATFHCARSCMHMLAMACTEEHTVTHV